jgi:hypothetical protein
VHISSSAPVRLSTTVFCGGADGDGSNNSSARGSADTGNIVRIKKLPSLCVKVSAPVQRRSVAQEAWMYEQLDTAGVAGTTTASCYGPFKSILADVGPDVVSLASALEDGRVVRGF